MRFTENAANAVFYFGNRCRFPISQPFFRRSVIPLVVLPAIILPIIVVTQFIMMLISSAALMPSGLSSTTWANFNLVQQSVILIYSLIVIALWHAPIYGWALLISGIARRATFLWAVMPFIAISIFEKITFNTTYFFSIDEEPRVWRR